MTDLIKHIRSLWLLVGFVACLRTRVPDPEHAATSIPISIYHLDSLDEGNGCEPYWFMPAILCAREDGIPFWNGCYWRCWIDVGDRMLPASTTGDVMEPRP